METLMALAVVLQDPDLAVQGRVRKRGGEYELTLVGRGKALEEDATVALRFHPISRRLAWEDRSIGAFTPVEAAAGRSAEVKKGAFTHVERFGAPGSVEVRILIERAGKPPLDPIVRTFRLAPGSEVAEAVGADLAELERAGEALLALLEEGEGILDAPCGAGRRGREYRLKVERRVGAWREAMSRSALPAAADAFARLAGDVETSVHSPCVRPLSSLSGRAFHVEETAAYLEGIREAMSREARLVVAGEVEAIRAEAVALARGGDSRAWERAEGGIRKSVEALRTFLDRRNWADGAFAALFDRTDELVRMVASATVCPGSDGLELEERQEALGVSIRALEEEIAVPR